MINYKLTKTYKLIINLFTYLIISAFLCQDVAIAIDNYIQPPSAFDKTNGDSGVVAQSNGAAVLAESGASLTEGEQGIYNYARGLTGKTLMYYLAKKWRMLSETARRIFEKEFGRELIERVRTERTVDKPAILRVAEEEYGIITRIADRLGMSREEFKRILSEMKLRERVDNIRRKRILELAAEKSGDINKMAKVLGMAVIDFRNFLTATGLLEAVLRGDPPPILEEVEETEGEGEEEEEEEESPDPKGNDSATRDLADFNIDRVGRCKTEPVQISDIKPGMKIVITGLETRGVAVVIGFQSKQTENDRLIVQFEGETRQTTLLSSYVSGKLLKVLEEDISPDEGMSRRKLLGLLIGGVVASAVATSRMASAAIGVNGANFTDEEKARFGRVWNIVMGHFDPVDRDVILNMKMQAELQKVDPAYYYAQAGQSFKMPRMHGIHSVTITAEFPDGSLKRIIAIHPEAFVDDAHLLADLNHEMQMLLIDLRNEVPDGASQNEVETLGARRAVKILERIANNPEIIERMPELVRQLREIYIPEEYVLIQEWQASPVEQQPVRIIPIGEKAARLGKSRWLPLAGLVAVGAVAFGIRWIISRRQKLSEEKLKDEAKKRDTVKKRLRKKKGRKGGTLAGVILFFALGIPRAAQAATRKSSLITLLPEKVQIYISILWPMVVIILLYILVYIIRFFADRREADRDALLSALSGRDREDVGSPETAVTVPAVHGTAEEVTSVTVGADAEPVQEEPKREAIITERYVIEPKEGRTFNELRDEIFEKIVNSGGSGAVLNLDRQRFCNILDASILLVKNRIDSSLTIEEFKRAVIDNISANFQLNIYAASDRLFPFVPEGIGINREALLALQEMEVNPGTIELIICYGVFYHQLLRMTFKGKLLAKPFDRAVLKMCAETAGINLYFVKYAMILLSKCDDIFIDRPVDIMAVLDMIDIVMRNTDRPHHDSFIRTVSLITELIYREVVPRDSRVILKILLYYKQILQLGIYDEFKDRLRPESVFYAPGSVLRRGYGREDRCIEINTPDLVILPFLAFELGTNKRSILNQERDKARKLLAEILADRKNCYELGNKTVYVYEKDGIIFRVVLENGFILYAEEIWPDEDFIRELIEKGVHGKGISEDTLRDYVKFTRLVTSSPSYECNRIIHMPGEKIEFVLPNEIVIGEVNDAVILEKGKVEKNNKGVYYGSGMALIRHKACFKGASDDEILALLSETLTAADRKEVISFEKGYKQRTIVHKKDKWFYVATLNIRDTGPIKGWYVKSFAKVDLEKINLWWEGLCSYNGSYEIYYALNGASDFHRDKPEVFSEGQRRTVIYDKKENQIHVRRRKSNATVIFDQEGNKVKTEKIKRESYYDKDRLKPRYIDITELVIRRGKEPDIGRPWSLPVVGGEGGCMGKFESVEILFMEKLPRARVEITAKVKRIGAKNFETIVLYGRKIRHPIKNLSDYKKTGIKWIDRWPDSILRNFIRGNPGTNLIRLEDNEHEIYGLAAFFDRAPFIMIHDEIFDNPIAKFHELAHLANEIGGMGELLLDAIIMYIKDKRAYESMIEKYGYTLKNAPKTIKVHCALRVLQREKFGREDEELSAVLDRLKAKTMHKQGENSGMKAIYEMVRKDLNDIGYGKKADEIVRHLKHIEKRKNTNTMSVADVNLLSALEKFLGYPKSTLSVKKNLREAKGKSLEKVREFCEVIKSNIAQWKMLETASNKQIEGIIVQDIKDLGPGVKNWLVAIKRYNIQGVKMGYVLGNIDPEQKKWLLAQKPVDVILKDSLEEIIGGPEITNVVYLSNKEELEKHKGRGIKLIEEGYAGPVLELSLALLLLEAKDEEVAGIYRKFTDRLKRDFKWDDNVKTIIEEYEASGIIRLPKIQKVLDMWNELSGEDSYLKMWA